MMDARRLFLVLCLLFFAGLVLWYVYFYQPIQAEGDKLQLQMNELIDKLKSANHATLDLQNVEKRLQIERSELQDIKNRFVNKNDLSSVTEKIRGLANLHNLEFKDFAPVLDNYFSDTTKTKIKSLPLAITVIGDYINIGKFIEDWGNQPLYLIAEEIEIEKTDYQSDRLRATIRSKLYTWRN